MCLHLILLLIEWCNKIQYSQEIFSFQQLLKKKIPATRLQVSVRGTISVTGRPRRKYCGHVILFCICN